MLEHGGDIKGFQDEFGTRPLDFSANIAPFGVPEPVRQAMVAALDDMVDYPDPLCRSLVAALAAHEQLPESYILCGAGCSDLLFRLAAACKPQRVLLCAPGFTEYEHAFDTMQPAYEYYELTPEQGFSVGEDILERIQPGLDAVVLCQPNNPTGVSIPRALLQQVLERCAVTGTLLIMDECFIGFMDDADQLTLVPLLAENPQLVVLKAFTKIYGIPGMRLGYALCSDAVLIERLRQAGQPWAVSTLAQAAGRAALTCDDYVDAVRTTVSAERTFLRTAFATRGIDVTGSVNFLFFHLDNSESFIAAMRAQGVLVRDCSNYRNLTLGWYRVAVRTHEENLRFLAALDAVLPQLTKEA